MTRTAPLLTLVAVALTGGALLTTGYLNTPAAPAPVPVAASAGVVPEPAGGGGTVPEPAAAPTAPAAATTYAGWTAGMGFTVALVVTGEDVVAYVCDGDDVEIWLTGTRTGGDLALRNADGTAVLTGTADADDAAGTVGRDGAEWSFTAEPMGVEEAAAAGRGDVRQVAERAEQGEQPPATEAPAEKAPAEGNPAAENPAAENPAAENPAAENPAGGTVEAPVEQDPSPGYPGSEY